MNKLFQILTILVLLFNFTSVFAQSQKLHSRTSLQKDWRDYRHELEIGFGASNYIGELGGNDGPGKRYSPQDIEFSQFKYAVTLAYRYNFGRYLSVKPQLYFGKVSGSDKLTAHTERNYRNLAFESSIIEFAIMAEGHLLRPTHGHSYYRKGVIGKAGDKFALSGHLGIGFFYFNPKYGSVALQPLNTEGQGLDGGAKPYSKMALCFPVGISGGYQVWKFMTVGLDITYRFSTTDYLDDVGGTYYDKEKLRSSNGDLSAELSDRSDGSNPNWTSAGSPRGNPKSKDNYFTVTVKATYTPFLHVSHVKKRRRRARF